MFKISRRQLTFTAKYLINDVAQQISCSATGRRRARSKANRVQRLVRFWAPLSGGSRRHRRAALSAGRLNAGESPAAPSAIACNLNNHRWRRSFKRHSPPILRPRPPFLRPPFAFAPRGSCHVSRQTAALGWGIAVNQAVFTCRCWLENGAY